MSESSPKYVCLAIVSALSLVLLACGGGNDAVSETSMAAPTSTSETTAAPDTTLPADATTVPANGDLPELGQCPTAVFPDLSAVIGPGAEYDLPIVVVECSTDELVVISNGMPSYAFESMTPNGLATQSWVWHVPLRPTVANSTTSINNVLGTLGFTTTGLPIYGPTEGPVPAGEAFGDPVYNGILDTCGGHTGFNADYHQHAINIEAYCNLDSSVIVGYALDGFPIYNSVGCINVDCSTTATFVSGYDMTGDPTSHSWDAYTYNATGKTNVLDECNGRIGPDGTYRYHATDTFPYILGCYAGTATRQSGNAAADMPPMGPP